MAIGTAQQMMARQLYLFIFLARQTTRTFFSGRNNDRAPAKFIFFWSYLERRNNGQTTVSFFSGHNWNGVTMAIRTAQQMMARRLYLFFRL